MKKIKLFVLVCIIGISGLFLSACFGGGDEPEPDEIMTVLFTQQEIIKTASWDFNELLTYAQSEDRKTIIELNYENDFRSHVSFYIRTLNITQATFSDNPVAGFIVHGNQYTILSYAGTVVPKINSVEHFNNEIFEVRTYLTPSVYLTTRLDIRYVW